MSLLQVNFFGNSLGLATSMNVIFPDNGKGPFPVLYLLHGLSDDQSIWLRRTGIERYASLFPLIVVMPTTHRGFYTNAATPPGLKYEDHIIQDVVGAVDRVFPTIRNRKGRAIGGLSMGGYGAMKLGLKYPDMFCSIHSHSGALLGAYPRSEKKGNLYALREMHPEMLAIFGEDREGSVNDPVELARKCPKNKRPAIKIDCGNEDFLLEDNQIFHNYLQKMKFPHEYTEYAGDENWASCGILNTKRNAHDWGFWDLHIQEALVFHCQNLGIALPEEIQKRVKKRKNKS